MGSTGGVLGGGGVSLPHSPPFGAFPRWKERSIGSGTAVALSPPVPVPVPPPCPNSSPGPGWRPMGPGEGGGLGCLGPC